MNRQEFIEKIAKEYSLSDSQVEELKKAQAQTKGAVDVPLGSQKAEPNYIETAVMFARDFSHLSAEQVERLNRLLKDFETSGEKTKNGRKFQFGPSRLNNKAIRILDQNGQEVFLATIRFFE